MAESPGTYGTPGRMLQLLGLLQARDSWLGAELAERMEVTERTVRRDVDRLRQLGYPVEALTGRNGGYRLGRGGRLPPLLLSDEEAVAVAIGLREAVDGTVDGIEDSVVGVLAKLEQLLPAHLAQRVRAVHENTASVGDGRSERIPAGHLLLLTHACSARQRVRFAYSDKVGNPTSRLVEPLGVVRRSGRWYLAARDIDRRDWRTFRLDRMTEPVNVGTGFELVDPPSAVELVSVGLASMPAPFTARIRIAIPAEQALRFMPPTVAVLESRPGESVLEIGGPSVSRMASYLAGIWPACEILDPPELRRMMVDQATAVAAANATADE